MLHRLTDNLCGGLGDLTAILIDQYGALWDAGSQKLHQQLQVESITPDVIEFLLRNGGYISVRAFRDSLLVGLAPTRVRPVTLLTISRLLASIEPYRVLLSRFEEEWEHEILVGQDAARSRLMELVAGAQSTGGDKHLSRELRLDSLERTNPLLMLVEKWRQQGGQIDLSSEHAVLSECVDGRLLTVEREAASNRLVFASVGTGWGLYGANWPRHIVGQRVEYQPDLQHGRWVASRFLEAMVRAEPILTENDVLIKHPERHAPTRVQYHRITLPIEAPDGRHQILSATRIDPRIDLRSKIDNEPEQVVN